jgi:hypothetical protein
VMECLPYLRPEHGAPRYGADLRPGPPPAEGLDDPDVRRIDVRLCHRYMYWMDTEDLRIRR